MPSKSSSPNIRGLLLGLQKPGFAAPALLISLAFIWGSSFMLMKRGLAVFPANQVGALRVTAAFFFLLPFSLPRLRRLGLLLHLRLFASGMMGIFLPAFLFSIAQTQIASSLNGVLNSLTPIWAMVVGMLVGGQPLTKKAIVGALLGFGGVAFLIIVNSEGGIGAALLNIYALLPVIASFLYGCNLNFIRYRLAGVDSLTITSMATFFTGIMASTYLLTLTDFTARLAHTTGAFSAFLSVVVLGLMSTAVAIILMNHLIKIRGPLYASLSTYLAPVVAVAWGLADGERLGLNSLVGVGAIVIGIYLSRKG